MMTTRGNRPPLPSRHVHQASNPVCAHYHGLKVSRLVHAKRRHREQTPTRPPSQKIVSQGRLDPAWPDFGPVSVKCYSPTAIAWTRQLRTNVQTVTRPTIRSTICATVHPVRLPSPLWTYGTTLSTQPAFFTWNQRRKSEWPLPPCTRLTTTSLVAGLMPDMT